MLSAGVTRGMSLIVSSIAKRTIYGADYLGLDQFATEREQKLACESDIDQHRKRILTTPVADLRMDDVEAAVYLAKTPGEVAQAASLISQVIDHKKTDLQELHWLQRRYQKLLSNFFLLCYASKSLAAAEEVFAQGRLIDSLNLKSGGVARQLLLPYAVALFDAGKHEDVIRVYELVTDANKGINFSILKVALASCLMLNTAASTEKSFELIANVMKGSEIPTSRMVYTHALLASRHGRAAEAYEILSLMTKPSSKADCFKVHLLTCLGRTEAVLAHFEQLIVARPKLKPEFTVQVLREVKRLVCAPEEEALKIRLAKIFDRLDDVASVMDKTLDEIVMEPIKVRLTDFAPPKSNEENMKQAWRDQRKKQLPYVNIAVDKAKT